MRQCAFLECSQLRRVSLTSVYYELARGVAKWQRPPLVPARLPRYSYAVGAAPSDRDEEFEFSNLASQSVQAEEGFEVTRRNAFHKWWDHFVEAWLAIEPATRRAPRSWPCLA